ncbi:hypothetical protein BCR34DRAFT_560034 [Clohesyomyces aquaticus]|uniref:Uncharacterized protein n=1 Tax=Clohesyomyces aquaticus TaxID=1231657 RepID=A0A1Y1ZWM6_9PLEO|nr:hypothetical protein BCR34DRAFT_560034 [Clohesyomyces aquaticus]
MWSSHSTQSMQPKPLMQTHSHSKPTRIALTTDQETKRFDPQSRDYPMSTWLRKHPYFRVSPSQWACRLHSQRGKPLSGPSVSSVVRIAYHHVSHAPCGRLHAHSRGHRRPLGPSFWSCDPFRVADASKALERYLGSPFVGVLVKKQQRESDFG